MKNVLIKKATKPTKYMLKGKDGYTRYVETLEEIAAYEKESPGNWTIMYNCGGTIYSTRNAPITSDADLMIPKKMD